MGELSSQESMPQESGVEVGASVSGQPQLAGNLTEDGAAGLPPVQPPSAGFIVQLFVVPGLIVLAVVAVWALFGRIAVGEQDWHRLVSELRSPNHHIRQRAMYGLSQVLDQDRRRVEYASRNAQKVGVKNEDFGKDSRQGSEGPLASNPEIAFALAEQLVAELKLNSNADESIKMQQFLARSLGWFDLTGMSAKTQSATRDASINGGASVASRKDAVAEVLMALNLALEATRNIEIRKSAAASVAFIASRSVDQGTQLDAPEVVQSLITSSTDSEGVIRHASTFALGFFRNEEALQQLRVLLGHRDELTRVNAAIALTRSGDTEGLAVFKSELLESIKHSNERTNEVFVIQKNILHALTELSSKMAPADKTEFREIVTKIMGTHTEPRIRVDCQNAINSLR